MQDNKKNNTTGKKGRLLNINTAFNTTLNSLDILNLICPLEVLIIN